MNISKNVQPERASHDASSSPTGPTKPESSQPEVHASTPEPVASATATPTVTPKPVAAEEEDDLDTPILDANTQALGVAPAFAMGTLMQTSAAAVGLSHQNAVHAQNLQYALSNAVTLESLDLLRARRVAAHEARLESTLERVVTALDSLSATQAKSKPA